jgi:hypothetical protein
VPFSPYGAATVSRQPSPHMVQFLLDLAKSDGADQTRSASNGELGLFTQQDAGWHDQTGAPVQPHPGNTKGPKDTTGGPGTTSVAAMADEAAAPQPVAQPVSHSLNVSLTSETGTWQSSGVSHIALASGNNSSLSTLSHDISRFEQVVFDVKLSTRGMSGIMFDYRSPTDFKFVGIDSQTNQVIIGHRTASGWHYDATLRQTVARDVEYALSLQIVGNRVTVLLNGQETLTRQYGSSITGGRLGLFTLGGRVRTWPAGLFFRLIRGILH